MGIAAALSLEREDHAVLSARAAYPLRLSLHPLRAGTIEDGHVKVRVESEEIPLTDFDPLLPLDIGLGGFLTIALTGEGPVRDYSLDGKFVTRDLDVAVADKAEIVAESDVRLSGSRAHPVIKGDVKIRRGLIRVPDMPKNLHAREGKALLWRDSFTAAAPDTTAVPRAATEDAKQEEKRRFAGELDVSIRIPSEFWIRGKGLNIELAGDLNIQEKNGRPFITGELRAIRGDFIVLGRTLDLERGTVTFYGGDETNPSLDISLTTNVEDTKIEILFSGTAQKPRIDMRSEPDMSETDIVSVLLFGSSVGDLDDDQADLAKQRSTEMLASVGAAKLQEEIGGKGVDVVTVKSAGADNEGSAVSLGKYLNPRTLLSYAYPLDTQSQASVSLEYFLKGRFVVKSTYETHEGLGSIGLGWSKDY
jgi:translocation and assembly module TamB